MSQVAENSSFVTPIFWGVKSGMTRIFDASGNHVPVTVIKLIPNYVSQIKTLEKDGYNAYQVAYMQKREVLVKKPTKGHLAKANILDKCLSRFSEIRIDSDADVSLLGKDLSLSKFAPETLVDVTSLSKGKGFQGVMKRYHFSGGPASHGSHFHRHPGAIGNRATPARVFKEKKMPGHMGNKKVTIQNQTIVSINLEKGYALIKGVVPGHKNSVVKVSLAVKNS
ncbi:MAG: 50S ribosomal protein L3 [Oligoflexia bacterium]|nr:50S ribosomal protein L3 [Oligoflexia bacterium]